MLNNFESNRSISNNIRRSILFQIYRIIGRIIGRNIGRNETCANYFVCGTNEMKHRVIFGLLNEMNRTITNNSPHLFFDQKSRKLFHK